MFPGLNSLVMNLILSFLLTVIAAGSSTQCPTDFPQVILNHTKHSNFGKSKNGEENRWDGIQPSKTRFCIPSLFSLEACAQESRAGSHHFQLYSFRVFRNASISMYFIQFLYNIYKQEHISICYITNGFWEISEKREKTSKESYKTVQKIKRSKETCGK